MIAAPVDAAAFARIQAGGLDRGPGARPKAYGRNNSGNYAEASEFFDVLVQRSRAEGGPGVNRGAPNISPNQAIAADRILAILPQAKALFTRARRVPRTGPDQLSSASTRNFRALNRTQPPAPFERPPC
ncbi:MAG: hypothetical protein U5M50_09965 [Sphingobium sp.]|nr:hypothetical protein [Sphingobium sp.]